MVLLKCGHFKSSLYAGPHQTIRNINLQQIILHVGTNDLKSERTSSYIAKSIKSTKSTKSMCNFEENTITVDDIVPRLDDLTTSQQK